MSAPTVERTVITEPGVYQLTADAYFADPVLGGSLSSTGARKLLPPSCPAKFAYDRDHRPAPKREFDLGHAAHKYVLRAGADIVEVDAANYKTKAAQETRDAAYDAGKIPLLPHEHAQVKAMAAAIQADPLAAFDPARGEPEQALVWVDEETGIWCRALVDWLPNPAAGRLVLRDFKTTASAEPSALARSFNNYGYWQQAAWYIDGARTLGLGGDDTTFLFVCQEKAAPYVITLAWVHPDDVAIGRARNRRAIEIYRDCVNADVWPGYATGITTIRMPAWAARDLEEQL